MITKKQWFTALLMLIAFLLVHHYFFKEKVAVTPEQIRSNYEKLSPAEKTAIQQAINYFLPEGVNQ